MIFIVMQPSFDKPHVTFDDTLLKEIQQAFAKEFPPSKPDEDYVVIQPGVIMYRKPHVTFDDTHLKEIQKFYSGLNKG